MIEIVASVAAAQIARFVTGQLLTEDQIRNISTNAVGQYLKDFLPTPKAEAEIEVQVEQAMQYIGQASQIIAGLQSRLEGQASQLNQILSDIEEKKKLAEHYQTLAATNQQAFSAFKLELEKTVRDQLRAEVEGGRRGRQIVNAVGWLLTLVLGAALGAYFIQIVDYLGKAMGFQ